MLNKKINTVILGAALAAVVSAPVLAAPSAKFAATWSTEPALASLANTGGYVDTDTVVTDSHTGYTIATIKVPQDKELLVGVSAEIGLITDTSIKGKNGGSAKAIADAEAFVTLFAVPVDGGDGIEAAPGQVMLSKRVQALSATLGGVIQSCTDSLTVDTNEDGVADAGDGTIVIADECVVTDEEIGLMQNTTAAHHFNFVLPNMDQGEYDIKAVFTTGSRAEVIICDSKAECDLYDAEGTVEGMANAAAVINKTMVTVQQVRAAKDGLNLVTITEP